MLDTIALPIEVRHIILILYSMKIKKQTRKLAVSCT